MSEDLPKISILEGHGETELPASFKEQMEKDNMELSALSLLTAETVPEDADCVVIFGPQSDISPEEKEILSGYVENGGKLFVAAGPVKDEALENLNSLLEDYGVTVADGIVVEGDREHYALQTPHALIPELADHEITASLAEARYFPSFPFPAVLRCQKRQRRAAGLQSFDYIGAGVRKKRLRLRRMKRGTRMPPFVCLGQSQWTAGMMEKSCGLHHRSS